LAERRSEALDRCVLDLRDGSLHGSIERGRFQNYYACGNIVAVWSVAALGDPDEFDRLFDDWRGVFANVDPKDARYDRDSYFRALESLGVGTDAIERLRTFVDATLDDPASGEVEILAGAGIEVVVLDRPSSSMRREQAAAALEHLMGQTCDGRFSSYRDWPRLRTAEIEDCEPFGREMRIVTIQGHEIDSDGTSDVIAAFDEQSGAELWRFAVEPTYRGHDGSHDGPMTTPLIHDGRVFGLGESCRRRDARRPRLGGLAEPRRRSASGTFSGECIPDGAVADTTATRLDDNSGSPRSDRSQVEGLLLEVD
jgi:hypothetical protein